MPDDRFGRIAIDQGYITREHLEECLLDQRRRRAEGDEVEVGQILIERRYLTKGQFLDVLAIQKSIPWICRSCEVLYDTRELDPDAPGVCPRCAEKLDVPRRRENQL